MQTSMQHRTGNQLSSQHREALKGPTWKLSSQVSCHRDHMLFQACMLTLSGAGMHANAKDKPILAIAACTVYMRAVGPVNGILMPASIENDYVRHSTQM